MKTKKIILQLEVKVHHDDGVLADELNLFVNDIASEIRISQSRWGIGGVMRAESVDVRVIRSSQPNVPDDRPAATAGKVRRVVMCSECGCKNQATHTRPSWIKKNADMPICKKHVEFYNAVGLHTKIIQPHNAENQSLPRDRQ